MQFRRGEQMWQGQKVIAYQNPQFAILADLDGNWIGVVSGDKPMWTWDPPLNWEYPLELGKTWTHNSRLTNYARSQTTPFKYTQKVEAYEDVTVPAGTFKAFKISTSDTLGNENVQWFSPQLRIFVKQAMTRTAKHAAGAGKQESELVSYTDSK